MKITFNFDKQTRAFNLEPEDELEFAVLAEMEAQTAKGQTIILTKINHPMDNVGNGRREFRVEMKVNGHTPKVLSRPQEIDRNL